MHHCQLQGGPQCYPPPTSVLWSTYSPAPCKDCLEPSPPSLDMALPPAHLPSALNPVSRFREMRNQAEIFPASCYQTKLLSTPHFFLSSPYKEKYLFLLSAFWYPNKLSFQSFHFSRSSLCSFSKVLCRKDLVHFFLSCTFFIRFIPRILIFFRVFFFSSSVSLLNIVNIQNIVITTLSMSLCANSNIWLSSGFVSIDGLNLLTMGPVYLILCMRPCLELFFPLPNDLW